MTTFYAILVGGTIHGKGGPSTAAVDGPAGPVTAADHIWRDTLLLLRLHDITRAHPYMEVQLRLRHQFYTFRIILYIIAFTYGIFRLKI